MAALILQKPVERGSVTMTTTTVTSTVTLATALQSTAKTILLFTVKSTSASPIDYAVHGGVISTTQIEFKRAATPATDVTIEWQVIEFSSGISVQHLNVTQTGATNIDTTISSVDTAKSFVIVTYRQTGATYGTDDGVIAEITTATNVQTRAVAGGANLVVNIQVVQIDDATVQKSVTTMGAGTTKDITLTTIAPEKTFWLYSHSNAAALSFNSLPYLAYVNSTTIRFTRGAGTVDLNFVVYVVSLSAGVSVQNISTVIASSGTTVSPSIASVNINNTALLLNGQYQKTASIDAANDDAGGNHFALTGLTSTAFTATRSSAPALAATTNIQVMEFVSSNPQPKRRNEITFIPGLVPKAFRKKRESKGLSSLSTITGTLAKTNANDTIAASGSSTVNGSLAKTNANDTLSASGSPTVIGSLAKTNANDTVVASGTSTISGSLSKTNANDTSSASGSSTVTGALAKTNANDTLAASGSPTVSGSLAKTNANDACTASGSVGSPVTGTVNKTNANDTSSASGNSTVSGSLAKTNANDSASASGSGTVNGSLAKTNNNDSGSIFGSPTVNGSLSKTNANDSCAASGSVGSAVSGTVSYTNANDSISASGTSTVTGSLAKTNTNDSRAISGSPIVSGSLAKTNANDSCSASGSVGSPVTGTVNKTNANDTSSASGNIGVTGSANITNQNDTCSAAGKVSLVGILSVFNANDLASALGLTKVTGSVNYTNNNDFSTTSYDSAENVDLICTISLGHSLTNTISTNHDISNPITTNHNLNTVIIE